MKKVPLLSPDKQNIAKQKSQIPTADYWSKDITQLLSMLDTSSDGLRSAEANERLKLVGLNTIRAKQKTTAFRLILSQFKSPLVLNLNFCRDCIWYCGRVDRCYHRFGNCPWQYNPGFCAGILGNECGRKTKIQNYHQIKPIKGRKDTTLIHRASGSR